MTNEETFMSKELALAFIVSTEKVLSSSKDPSNIALHHAAYKYYLMRPQMEALFPEIFQFMPGIIEPIAVRNQYGGYTEQESVEAIINETKAFLEFWSTYNSTNTSITPPPERIFVCD